MVLLGDEAQLEAHFGPSGDGPNLDARSVHGLRRTYHRLIYHLGRTRWCSKVTMLNWKLVLVCSQLVLIFTQDRGTVCAEHTIGSEIILDAPDGTPR